MATVNYNGYTVSDQIVKDVLQNISDYFQADVNVTSGNRTTVPEGGSTSSLHLENRAADFHVVGIDDGTAYLNLKNLGYDQVFKSGNVYEFIWHGIYTATGGQHLHLGRSYSSSNGKVAFKIEGTTPATKKKYAVEIEAPITKKLNGT